MPSADSPPLPPWSVSVGTAINLMFAGFTKESPRANGVAYATDDRQETAEELFRRGDLVTLFFMPLEFNGHDCPVNTLAVPNGAAVICHDAVAHGHRAALGFPYWPGHGERT